MLYPMVQIFIAREWLKCQPTKRFSDALIDQCQKKDWIIENSGGAYEPCDVLEESLKEHCALSNRPAQTNQEETIIESVVTGAPQHYVLP